MDELLQEFVCSRGLSVGVDRAGSVIRGVKLLGLESRNNRRYLPQALAGAAALYEGAKVNVNHPKGNPLAARDYQDRLGVVRSVVCREGVGLFGDLHFNPKHALAEQLMWDAEHAPENLGLSHNVTARTTRQGAQVIVEAILQVQSVDLVADPATTRGLFENLSPTVIESATDAVEAPTPSPAPNELELLREQLIDARQQLAHAHRQSLIRETLGQFSLPSPDDASPRAQAILSRPFWDDLMSAADEATVRRLIEDRARLVEQLERRSRDERDSIRPRSREQNPWGERPRGELSTASFIRAITGR